jgi:hypothetical protein
MDIVTWAAWLRSWMAPNRCSTQSSLLASQRVGRTFHHCRKGMLSTIYILLTALADEGYLPPVYREAISCLGTNLTTGDVGSSTAIKGKPDLTWALQVGQE